MAEQENSLSGLFAPPEGMRGTHLLICGMTAQTGVLNRILDAFTGEVEHARRMHPHLHGLLLLDASQPMLPLSAMPRLFHVPPPEPGQWRSRTSLLHAKVALLGFSNEKFGATTLFRLIVSTGNWTSESFFPGGQIDMVWTTEGTPTKRGASWKDCASAYGFFRRLLEDLYRFNHAALPGATDWFDEWDAKFAQDNPRRGPHFIHSLDNHLFNEIKAKFPRDGYGTLVAGSGFYETGAPTDIPDVLARIGTLKDRKLSECFLVVNPCRAGAVASWLKHDKEPCWTPCKPVDPVARRGQQRTTLHAKFIAALYGGNHIRAMYLGSGNLTRKGLLSRARLAASGSSEKHKEKVGNIEAGVVFEPVSQPEDAWRALACGEELRRVSQFEAGDNEPSPEPGTPPPIVLFRQDGNRLIPEWAEGAVAAQWEDAGTWRVLRKREALDCGDRVPPMVHVRRDTDQQPYEIPVITADGSFGRLPGVPMSGVDVINAINDFPRITGLASDDEDGQDDDDTPGDKDPANPRKPPAKANHGSGRASKYPLKTMMTMIEAIADRNQSISKEQFPVWLSLLRTMLCEQLGKEEQAALRGAGINPFPVLLRPGFSPPCITGARRLEEAYKQLLGDVARQWKLAGFPVPGRTGGE